MTAAIEACNKSDVAVYPLDLRPFGSETTPAQLRMAPSNPIWDDRARRAGTKGHSDDDTVAPPIFTQGARKSTIPSFCSGWLVEPEASSFPIPASCRRVAKDRRRAERILRSQLHAFRSPGSKAGSCHTLRVKVDRSGTTVRARADYCESKPQDLLAGTVTGQDLERRATSTQTGTIGASMQLSHFYLSPGVARVNLAMEIPPEALKFQNQKGKPRSSYAELNLLGIASAPGRGCGGAVQRRAQTGFGSRESLSIMRGSSRSFPADTVSR